MILDFSFSSWAVFSGGCFPLTTLINVRLFHCDCISTVDYTKSFSEHFATAAPDRAPLAISEQSTMPPLQRKPEDSTTQRDPDEYKTLVYYLE
jgi:hypothetical protein